MKNLNKSYSKLMQFETHEERFRYLKINGKVGVATFGSDRYLNQLLYTSPEWREFRRKILIRDNGCDMACEGFDIDSYAVVHHINPITVEDVVNRNPMIFDPENVITVSSNTHRAIHYGDESLLVSGPIERTKNDTCPWRHD